MEALISSMTASGLVVNRPPHILLLMTRLPGTSRNVALEMTGPEETARTPIKRRRAMIAGGVVVAVALAAVYGIAAFRRNAPDAACGPAVEAARRVAPFARGEVAAFVAAEQPLRLPNVAFRDASGTERHLANWHGRTLLLNLWATWCIPCRKEMPALEALE